MIAKFSQQSLCLVQGFLKRVWICPCEVCSISLRFEIIEVVCEPDVELTITLTPLEHAIAAFPFHRVWMDSVDRPQAHLIEFTLHGHPSYIESESLIILDAFHTVVKPGPNMAHLRVR